MTRDDGYTRYTMRIPTDLYDRIKEAAGEKSVNAEVLGVLEKAYPPPPSRDSLMRAFDLLTGVASKMRARIRAGEVEGNELAELKEELAEADAALKILGDRIIAGKD